MPTGLTPTPRQSGLGKSHVYFCKGQCGRTVWTSNSSVGISVSAPKCPSSAFLTRVPTACGGGHQCNSVVCMCSACVREALGSTSNAYMCTHTQVEEGRTESTHRDWSPARLPDSAPPDRGDFSGHAGIQASFLASLSQVQATPPCQDMLETCRHCDVCPGSPCLQTEEQGAEPVLDKAFQASVVAQACHPSLGG